MWHYRLKCVNMGLDLKFLLLETKKQRAKKQRARGFVLLGLVVVVV